VRFVNAAGSSATGFPAEEDPQSYFEMLRETVRRRPVALAIYSDRRSTFLKTKDKEPNLEAASGDGSVSNAPQAGRPRKKQSDAGCDVCRNYVVHLSEARQSDARRGWSGQQRRFLPSMSNKVPNAT
jgi:hypothetical protein